MTVAVYQIQYSEEVIGGFDPAFIRYDCRDSAEPERRETAHMLRFYEQSLWKREDVDYFGLVSPKFASKTGIDGATFLEWIAANPGHSVYFINPFPQVAYWHYNVWTQGEYWHPGVADLADALFAAAGYSIQTRSLPRNTASSLLYSNYWVGDREFWRTFMGFMSALTQSVEALSGPDKERLFKLAPHSAPAAYYPFVFERLFSTFLVLHDEIRRLAYPYARHEILRRCTSEAERFVVSEWSDRIDAWDAEHRDDARYRALFAGLEDIVRKGDTADGLYDAAPAGGEGLMRRFVQRALRRARR